MDIFHIQRILDDFMDDSPLECLDKSAARKPELAGMRFYDGFLIGCTPATDEYLAELPSVSEAGLPNFLPPLEWLPTGRTVISIFAMFSSLVRSSNRLSHDKPSHEWLHARREGQQCLDAVTAHLCEQLSAAGHKTVAPNLDSRFWSKPAHKEGDPADRPPFSSNWSERHVAYAAGLGTFGLSRGLITRGGVAGRLTSVITELSLPVTPKQYSGLYDYCSMCGVCAEKCPGGAISLKHGKDHEKCSAFLGTVRAENNPYFGCGKCQVGVPCETCLPPQRDSD